ncbi:hypothetical protein TRVL_07512 [Trypanosoma vivax]|nr:hypothetical protein TRVL_07512 [Trypanosoma vivax]
MADRRAHYRAVWARAARPPCCRAVVTLVAACRMATRIAATGVNRAPRRAAVSHLDQTPLSVGHDLCSRIPAARVCSVLRVTRVMAMQVGTRYLLVSRKIALVVLCRAEELVARATAKASQQLTMMMTTTRTSTHPTLAQIVTKVRVQVIVTLRHVGRVFPLLRLID